MQDELYTLVRQDPSIFEFLHSGSLDGIWYWDVENPQHEWMSPRFWTTLGYDPKEKQHLAAEWQNLIDPEDLKVALANFKRHCEDPNHPYDQVVRYRHRDGHTVWVRCRGIAIRDAQGRAIRMLGAHNDITSQKQTEEVLRKSEQRLNLVLEAVQDAVWDWRADTGETYFSPRWYTMLGYCPDQFPPSYETWRELLHPQDLPGAEQTVRAHLRSGEPFEMEFRMWTQDGQWRWVLCRGKTVEKDAAGRSLRMLGTNVDITARKQREEEQEITLQLLRALYRANDFRGLVAEITGLMKSWSGCEAVGIRLRAGDDFPYWETRGFSPAFVEAERRLCALDQKGELVRDSQGNPVLECMCGNIICGRFNPALPFFTPYGSFWTNSTTQLLASTSEVERQARTRNRCHGQGYESVALVPLRIGDERIGLLQFNDTRRDRFTIAQIELLERLGASLAVGLSQRMTAMALRESEETLRAGRQKFKSIVDNIGIGVVLLSPQMEILELNRQMRQWYPQIDINQRPVCYQAFKHPPCSEACDQCPTIKTLRDGQVYEAVVIKSRAGELRRHRVIASPIINEHGTVTGVIEMVEDITDRLRLEEKLRQAQKMESIGALAGGIAHDFNNLLFPIIGMSELLLEDLPSGSQAYHNVQEILEAGKRGGELVKQILAFSRQAEHRLKPVRFQLVLKEALRLVRAAIPADIEIAQEIQYNCGVIMADPTQLHQIAMNLITNAYHAVEQTSGRIWVTLKEVSCGQNEVAGTHLEPGSYVLLSVADDGCGIDPAHMDKIFEPYFTTKAQGKGTGLGLAVVYGIVREHGGDIKISSELGKGTTVQVHLPLIQRPAEIQRADSAAALQTGQERVLLVDDEDQIIRLEKQMLERLGYRVSERRGSLDALQAFKAQPNGFDLVITDMAMPHMNGELLAKELMAIRPEIPVIICTGFSERINAQKAAALGIKGFLMKPVIRSELAAMVRKVLDEAKAPSS